MHKVSKKRQYAHEERMALYASNRMEFALLAFVLGGMVVSSLIIKEVASPKVVECPASSS